MAGNDIQLKRSSVAGRVPDAANVLVGEPVVNLSDKIIFTKDGNGNVIVIGAGTTSNVAEGSNLYFTNARARASISVTGSATYDANTGVIAVAVSSFPAGDYGDLTQVVDAFGISTASTFDCNQAGSITSTDFGSV